VTDRVGAGADYVVDGRTGFVVTAADEGTLAAGMMRLVDAGLAGREEMGGKCREIALARTKAWAAAGLEKAVVRALEGQEPCEKNEP